MMIKDPRGHQVQCDLVGLKGSGFGNNVQKLGVCTPNIGEMAAFSIRHVKHYLGEFCSVSATFRVLHTVRKMLAFR